LPEEEGKLVLPLEEEGPNKVLIFVKPQYVIPPESIIEPEITTEIKADVVISKSPKENKWYKVHYVERHRHSRPFNRDWIENTLIEIGKRMALPAPCQRYAGFEQNGRGSFVNIPIRAEGDYLGLGARPGQDPRPSFGCFPGLEKLLKSGKHKLIQFIAAEPLKASFQEKTDMGDNNDPIQIIDIPIFKTDLPQFPKVNEDREIQKYVLSATDACWISADLDNEGVAKICYLWQKEFRPSPIIAISVDQEPPRFAMLDTGATVTLISYTWFKEISRYWTKEEYWMRRSQRAPQVFGISGAELQVEGRFLLSLRLGRKFYHHKVVVIKAPGEEYNPTNHKVDMIIGVDFMRRFKMSIGFGRWTPHGQEDNIYIGVQKFRAERIPQPYKRRYIGASRIYEMNLWKDVEDQINTVSIYKPNTTIRVTPLTVTWVTFKPMYEEERGYVVPQLIAPGVVVLAACWTASADEVNILIFNANAGPYEIVKRETWHLMTKVRENEREKGVHYVNSVLSTQNTPAEVREKNWQDMLNTVVSQSSELNKTEKQRLRNLLLKYKANLGLKHEPPGLVKDFVVPVRLTSDEPINIPQYRLPDAVQAEVHEQTEELLKHGIVSESTSRYNFPIVPVPKKIITNEGTVKKELRACLNLIDLNRITEIIFFIIPTIAGTFSRLAGACFFSSLDILSGFLHLPVQEEHRKYFAFSTNRGHYEYNRIPFGWINSPFYFQQFTQTRIANRHPEYTSVYIDDVMVHSKEKEQHFDHLDKVLDTVQSENVILKLSKCTFFQPELKYLGHIISKDGIRKDPEKVMAFLNTPPPKNKKESRRLMGMFNYYGAFMKDLAIIGHPIWKTTSQSDKVKFEWTPECEAARQTLMRMIAEDITLALPDPIRSSPLPPMPQNME